MTHTRNWFEAGFLAILVAVFMPLTGCSSGNQTPTNPVTIVYSNPNADSQCTCGNSKGAYAYNTSNTSREFTWLAAVTDNITNHPVTPSPTGSGTIGAGAKAFLGCTIYAPTNQCRYVASYQINGGAALYANVKGSPELFGAVISPSISSCRASCGNQNDSSSLACLPLGVRFYRAVAPLIQMVEAAQETGSTVSKAKIMEKYHLQASDDPCQRGDIKTAGGHIVNDGRTKSCVVSSAKLPTQMLRALDLDSLEAGKPLQMDTVLPRHVEAESQQNVRALDGSNVVVFRSMNSAPHITFEGAGGAVLNQKYGGAILASAEVQVSGSKGQMIVATQNGCLSVDKP